MSSEAKRLRSPPYPYIPLGKAVERAKQLYEKALHHSVGLGVLGDAWGYTMKSSGLMQTAAALIQFALMVDEGSGEKRKFQLTKEAIRIVQDADPDSDRRKELLKKAALAPKIHLEIWSKFTTATVADAVIKNYLMFDRVEADEAPFSAESAAAVISEYKSSISFAKIDTDGLPVGMAAQFLGMEEVRPVDDLAPQEHIGPTQSTRTTRPAKKVGMKEDVFSLKEGDVVLQWPEQISAESYQDLADWTEIILRKIKRSVSSDTEEGPRSD